MSSNISPWAEYSINRNYPDLKNDLIIRAARGESIPRFPVWIMRQAGRYLPEFREIRSKHNFFDLCQNPKLAAEVTLMPIKRFNLDAAIIFSDILVIPQALGMECKMEPGVGPVFPRPLTIEDWNKKDYLNPIDIIERLKYVGFAINIARHELQGKVPLIGFSGAPWTLMAYMIEGSGSKTYSKAKRWLYCYQEETHELLRLLSDVIADYIVMQIDSGAQLIQIFESSAEFLSKDLFNTFCMPYIKKIRDQVREKVDEKKLEHVPMILFGKGAHYVIEELPNLGYDVIGIDWTLDPETVKTAFAGKNVTIQGNLDPCALYAPEKVLTNATLKMLDAFKNNRYIVNLGHGIYPDMSIENVKIFVDLVNNYKK